MLDYEEILLTSIVNIENLTSIYGIYQGFKNKNIYVCIYVY